MDVRSGSQDESVCGKSCVHCLRGQVLTCVLVPALAATGYRVGCRTISPGEEQGCTFHSEETFTDTARAEKKKEQDLSKSHQFCHIMRSLLHNFINNKNALFAYHFVAHSDPGVSS